MQNIIGFQVEKQYIPYDKTTGNYQWFVDYLIASVNGSECACSYGVFDNRIEAIEAANEWSKQCGNLPVKIMDKQ